ncbi:MAG: prepilin-type N-terminal cleavage/methylation domain-containing protein [Pseudomonadota bacterium]
MLKNRRSRGGGGSPPLSGLQQPCSVVNRSPASRRILGGVGGFTLMELMVVLAIVVILLYVVAGSDLVSPMRGSVGINAHNSLNAVRSAVTLARARALAARPGIFATQISALGTDATLTVGADSGIYTSDWAYSESMITVGQSPVHGLDSANLPYYVSPVGFCPKDKTERMAFEAVPVRWTLNNRLCQVTSLPSDTQFVFRCYDHVTTTSTAQYVDLGSWGSTALASSAKILAAVTVHFKPRTAQEMLDHTLYPDESLGKQWTVLKTRGSVVSLYYNPAFFTLLINGKDPNATNAADRPGPLGFDHMGATQGFQRYQIELRIKDPSNSDVVTATYRQWVLPTGELK